MKKILTFSIIAYLLFTINSIGRTQNQNNLENENILKIGVLLPLSGRISRHWRIFFESYSTSLVRCFK